MIVFTANGRCAKIKADEPITTGSVGMPVSVVLSGDFDGLAATMVFACGDVSADVALMGQEVTVPPQVLEEAGRMLEIGVYGARADGTIVIPTVWAKADIVHEGVLPSGVDPAEPTPSWAAQVQQWAEDAHDTAEQLSQDVASWEAEIDTAIEDARDATQDATQTAASIAQAESSRVTAEQARATAESSRAAAESARVTAEASRATAESSRVAAESSRVTAEQARASAESSRAAAESGRSTAESARDEAESARSAAEATRAENEGTRITNESARANAESARDAAEQSREQAETGREAAWDTLSTQATAATQAANNAAQTASQAASDATDAAQAASQTAANVALAEQGRVQAEQARVTAEQGRATAETARASAETARATEWAEIEPAAQSATQSATVAAALATRAAEAAAAVVAAASNGNVPYGTLTGTVLTADDAWSAFAKGVEVFGKSTQDGTPTPDAPVPIKSVDDLTLNVCGFNVWDEQWDKGYIADATGTNVGNGNNLYLRSEGYIPVLPNAEYYFKCINGNPAGKVYYYDADKEYLSLESVGFVGSSHTTPASARYMRFWLNYPGSYNHDICINISDPSRNNTYAPYTGTVAPIPLSNHVGRSVPDGTEDTLTLTYLGPSETDGWGVYSKTLVQRVKYVADVTTLTVNGFSDSGARPYITFNISIDSNRGINSTTINTMATAHQGRVLSSYSSPCVYVTGNGGSLLIGDSGFSGLSQSDAVELLQGESVQYALATPITHDLGTVELPVNPAPDLTVWADGGSAQPNMSMEYERALSIVIPRIEAAISDLATS